MCKNSNLQTDILLWLSLLGSIFTPLDFSSVIFFTASQKNYNRFIREQKDKEKQKKNIIIRQMLTEHYKSWATL